MKLVVVDANAYWTSQLFAACADYVDVLLLKPREIRAHYAYNGSVFPDLRPQRVAPRVWEQRLPMPPFWLTKAWGPSKRLLMRAIRNFASSDELVLVLCFPEYRDLQKALSPILTVYYNYDDYAAHWPEKAQAIEAGEGALVQSANITICIADYRARDLRLRHPNKARHIHHIPIGCTPEFTADNFLAAGGGKPERLRGLRAPLAGYVGALNERFDFELIIRVAEMMPDVTFVLGGRAPSDARKTSSLKRFKELTDLPNVSHVDWVKHDDLGLYLNNFDVLLIPYTHCAHNRSACPAKLWDYMGTGLPIVANEANPEVLLWRHLLHIGATPEAFASSIRKALSENPSRSPQRLEVARQHSWDCLSKLVRMRIEAVLTECPAAQVDAS